MVDLELVRAGAQHALQASPGPLALLASVYGALFHVLVVRKLDVEEHLYAFLGIYLAAMASSVPVCASILHDAGTALGRAALLTGSFNLGLCASMLVYRAFFHRLRAFPGPFGARLSRFYVTAKSARDVQYHEVVRGWHGKYGDFIRTGPRELAIVRRSAVNLIYGPQSDCGKSTWYTQVSSDHTQCSIHMTRDWTDHKNRRKAWDRSFSVKAINTYAPRIATKVSLLRQQIALHAADSKPLDATKWAMLLTFDIMGAVGFGTDFGGLESGVEHPAIKGIHDHMAVLAITATVPWLLNLLGKVPGATKGYAPFFEWCAERAQQAPSEKPQQQQQPASDDNIFSHLLRAFIAKDTSAPPSAAALHEDARAVVIAGSDTTATTLTHVLYFLATHPGAQARLQSALDAAMPDGAWSFEAAKSVPYVDDVVNETLRLKPALLTGGYRTTPKEGLVVDGVHVPGGVNVFVPIQLIQTDERYYPRAGEFVPERWGEKRAEWRTVEAPWVPFSIGPYSCPGKALAVATLRIAVSQIALQFDVRLADGEDGREFDRGALDTFTTTLKPLMVTFAPREGKRV
ncbi:putative benzoate 4-monooxygenase cytochrome [Diplodia seriata]|uniref:Putative benzoate 4-monooxygenase cytochrome n=1 Tax=Diplodia seriata TaxID=420778 RepID=A0A0G2DXV4_9PEZI|nr:putative benzoate 4-monooxygenase cytochrome [Diplodia seriata]